MYNPPIADMLKPRESQLVKSFEAGSYYRPKSIQQSRQTHQRPPSQTSGQSRKRVVIVHRNGKKVENMGRMAQERIPKIQQASEKCIEWDPFLLDTISLEDPLWRQILPENMPIDANTVQHLVEDNPDYFYHHLGMCACYKCKCGRCKCDVSNQIKLKINGAMQTVYGKDFTNHRSDLNNLTPLNQTNYSTRFLDQRSIDLTSSNQQDYKEPALQSQENFKPPHRPAMGSVSNLTSYRSNYGNWGSNYQRINSKPHISTSPDIRFNGRTLYQDTFNNSGYKVDTAQWSKSQLSPLPSGPFMGSSTSLTTFQPFKVAYATKKPNNLKYETTPTYDGQFTTTGMRDFSKHGDDYCPANHFQKMWRRKLAQRHQQKKDSKFSN